MIPSVRTNVLLVIDTLSGGGAELVVYNLCKKISRDRFDVIVCCLGNIGERGEDLLKLGYDVNGLLYTRHNWNKYITFRELSNFVRAKNIDVIHSHSTQGLVDSSIAKLLNRRVRHIHTFHYGNYPNIQRKQLIMEQIFCRFPDKLVAVGNEQRKSIEHSFRLKNGMVETVWNGIDLDAAGDCGTTEAFCKREGKIIFGSISTLIEQKGLTYLLDAAKLLTKRTENFRVIIVGDGPLRNQLERKRKQLGLDDIVEFVGWVNNAAAKVLPAIDVFVQSSLWEAMSMVVLEAMAAKKPVIVTDVGDNRYVVKNNETGVIVPRADIERLAGKMEELINNQELRETLGRRAREWVTINCTSNKMANDYESIYLQVLGASF